MRISLFERAGLMATLLCLSCLLQAQVVFEIPHRQFKVDNLGQFYILSDNGIDLHRPDGSHFIHHSEELLGYIGSMDRTSSMRILVFYEDIPGIQLLDNTLSPHGGLFDLNEEGFYFITAVCSSVNNIYWGFNPVENELLRFNDQYRILDRTGNLVANLGTTLQPFKMLERDDRIYLADHDQGIFIFDQFGSFLNSLPLEGLIDMDVEAGRLIYLDAEGLHDFNMKNQAFEEIPLPESMPSPTGLDLRPGLLYLGDGQRILRWTIGD